jgi:hypothetical protein
MKYSLVMKCKAGLREKRENRCQTMIQEYGKNEKSKMIKKPII